MKFKNVLSAVTALMLTSVLAFSGCTDQKNESSHEESSTPQSSKEKQESSNNTDKSETSKTESEKENSAAESSEEEPEYSLPAYNKITPAVWEVTDSNANVIYMMGSIHAADADALEMPDYFETAYAKCDSLAVECDITEAQLDIFSLNGLLYTDGTTIQDHVPAADYKKAVEALSTAGSYSSNYDYMKPIMWSALGETVAIERAGLYTNYGIDTLLIKRAKNDKKTVLEVESVDSQYSLLANLSDEIQLLLYHQLGTDNYIDDMEKELRETYEAWKNGTLDESLLDSDNDTTEESLSDEELKLLEQYNDAMLNNRNKGMVEKALEYMKSGKKVMFVVGAAHFYGEKGILQLMKDSGCTIRQLTTEDAETIPAKATPAIESTEEEIAVPETDPGTARAA